MCCEQHGIGRRSCLHALLLLLLLALTAQIPHSPARRRLPALLLRRLRRRQAGHLRQEAPTGVPSVRALLFPSAPP